MNHHRKDSPVFGKLLETNCVVARTVCTGNR